MTTNPIPVVLAGWDLSITAHGTPAGQGAVSFLGKGRPAIHSNQKKLKPWRTAIITAAEQTMLRQFPADSARVVNGRFVPILTDPIEVDLTVTVPKPKTAPKLRRTWPITRYSSDIDHHARAVLDSLSEARVWKDDSQVVALTARKSYPGEHTFALDNPGAVVHVRVLPEAVIS